MINLMKKEYYLWGFSLNISLFILHMIVLYCIVKELNI